VRQPPYTTRSGLRIGCEYRPAQRLHHDEDACRLQAALLAGSMPRRCAGNLLFLAAALALLAAVIALLADRL
jgi:hypothetical protein